MEPFGPFQVLEGVLEQIRPEWSMVPGWSRMISVKEEQLCNDSLKLFRQIQFFYLTHLQVRWCQGWRVSSSERGFVEGCPRRAPGSGAVGSSPLERGMGRPSAEGGPHHGI